MADAQATFAIDLEDETSGAAESAARALEDLQRKIKADTQSLREMNRAMKGLQGGSSVSIEAFRTLKSQIDAKKQSIAEANAALVALGGTFGKIPKPAKEAASGTKEAARAAKQAAKQVASASKEAERASKKAGASFDDFASAAKGASPALESVLGPAGDLTRGIGALGLAGVVIAATVAVVALGAAVVAVAAKLFAFALASSDAARSQRILLEAAAGTAAGGEALAASVDRVSRNVAIGRGQVQAFGVQLAKAKLSGDELESALDAVSKTAAVGGDASALVRQLELAKKTGRSVEAIADKARAKFGGPAQKQMLAFAVQMAKAKENITRLFAGLTIEPFLKSLREVLTIFDDTTSSGRALKDLVEGIFNPILEGAAAAAPAVKDFFRGMILGALRVGTAFFTVKNAIADAFGLDLGGIAVDWRKVGTAVAVAAAAFLAVIGVVVAVVGGLAALAAAAFYVQVAFARGIALGIAKALELGSALIDWIGEAVGALAGAVADFASAGLDMMLGLAGGITSGVSAVIDAAVGAAAKAAGAVKNALGISSPSKVFAELGMQTSAGMEQGLEQGASGVQSAAEGLVSIPRAESSGGAGAAGARSSVLQLTIENLNVIGVQGADDPDFGDKLAEALERAMATLGLDPEPEPA